MNGFDLEKSGKLQDLFLKKANINDCFVFGPCKLILQMSRQPVVIKPILQLSKDHEISQCNSNINNIRYYGAVSQT